MAKRADRLYQLEQMARTGEVVTVSQVAQKLGLTSDKYAKALLRQFAKAGAVMPKIDGLKLYQREAKQRPIPADPGEKGDAGDGLKIEWKSLHRVDVGHYWENKFMWACRVI